MATALVKSVSQYLSSASVTLQLTAAVSYRTQGTKASLAVYFWKHMYTEVLYDPDKRRYYQAQTAIQGKEKRLWLFSAGPLVSLVCKQSSVG
jgi:hypothetical protein